MVDVDKLVKTVMEQMGWAQGSYEYEGVSRTVRIAVKAAIELSTLKDRDRDADDVRDLIEEYHEIA